MVFASPPRISISPAPPDDPLVEPYSPFKSEISFEEEDATSWRPTHLTPPPTHTSFPVKPHSPLRPVSTVSRGQGLERERFEAILKVSRERNAVIGTRKGNDLRKEIAVKAHKTKQAERRALFLSKVAQPPCPSAATLPKTPPESPAIFHYTLPSPGLVSPLALFESLEANSNVNRQPWVEQVDFKLPPHKAAQIQKSISPARKPTPLPSLDQISARLNHFDHTSCFSSVRPNERQRLSVGRLQIPIRVKCHTTLPPNSPHSPLSPQLQITTTVVPRCSTTSPTELSEVNLLALASRQRRAQDMLSTLKRRTVPSDLGLNGRDSDDVSDGRKYRRQSAPADLYNKPRTGFEHPVLLLPGGF